MLYFYENIVILRSKIIIYLGNTGRGINDYGVYSRSIFKRLYIKNNK